jgi:rare lipoprotein A
MPDGRRRLAQVLAGCMLLAASPALLSMPVSSADGFASYYGAGFHGRRTASGERFDQHALTAAHRTLSFGTKVRVTNARNGNSVVVTVNDRGPFVRGRVIDVSRAAAQRLGMLGAGVAPVRLDVVERDGDRRKQGGGLLQELF